MWKPPITLNFITLHYAYILSFGIWALIILYPYGNLTAIDAYFFGVSASTESGLNTVDVKALKTYQQLFIYFVPMITNLGFISPIPVAVRLFWFKRHLKSLRPKRLSNTQSNDEADVEKDAQGIADRRAEATEREESATEADIPADVQVTNRRIAIEEPARPEGMRDAGKSIYVPGPKEREAGQPLEYRSDNEAIMSESDAEDEDRIKPTVSNTIGVRRRGGPSLPKGISRERVSDTIGGLFILGGEPSCSRSRRTSDVTQHSLHQLSRQVTIGRNSEFKNLTKRDREILGGIEYRALKLCLKITVAYFFGLQIFGAIGLVGWVRYCNPKYTEYLASQGVDKIWWAFYSSATMADNLGFTLTPDSMISFRDATWPMLLMTFLAFAGNTLYPCCLRGLIWMMSKVVKKDSELHESLRFLLEHPRRCYTLLFPSKPTWILFAVIFVLNFVDVLLIIVLDLHNPELTSLAPGPRVLAAIFQAASSRHTGTATFNLANVNPAVQFSLMVMMYIAVYPIAISIRASNTYEERSLGLYHNHDNRSMDEKHGVSYVATHLRNQLSFDLWYVFLGVFCICIAESDKIADTNNVAFTVFAIFFEVVSAYGNVGLSLGSPDVLTSLSGKFTTFSKVVICAMMIRGRHRGLPYALDRAITLPTRHEELTDSVREDEKRS